MKEVILRCIPCTVEEVDNQVIFSFRNIAPEIYDPKPSFTFEHRDTGLGNRSWYLVDIGEPIMSAHIQDAIKYLATPEYTCKNCKYRARDKHHNLIKCSKPCTDGSHHVTG